MTKRPYRILSGALVSVTVLAAASLVGCGNPGAGANNQGASQADSPASNADQFDLICTGTKTTIRIGQDTVPEENFEIRYSVDLSGNIYRSTGQNGTSGVMTIANASPTKIFFEGSQSDEDHGPMEEFQDYDRVDRQTGEFKKVTRKVLNAFEEIYKGSCTKASFTSMPENKF